MTEFTGKTVVVTGAASGIGARIADAFEAEGALVWRLDRIVPPAERTFMLDVANAAAVEAAMAAIVAAQGSIDALVNSAGVYGLQAWGRIDEADFHRIFDVNVLGLALVTQAAAPHMSVGSAIINIASSAGRRGNPTSVLYAASKAAVISLTQSAALAFAGRKIRVNAIAPGRVQTPMWDDVLRRRAESTGTTVGQLGQTMADGVPLERMASPDDIARPALFLASAASGYITGQTINVDGGLQLN